MTSDPTKPLCVRSKPTGCRHEPGYPGLNTVVFCIGAPYLTVHDPSERCAIQEPHQTDICGEWND